MSRTGNIFSLNRYLDQDRILCVAGRLKKASILYEQKHPAILLKKLGKIYFSTVHRKFFHVGPQGLLNSVRLKF